MEMRVGVRVMQCRPVKLVGTPRPARPLEQVPSPLVAHDKLDEPATEHRIGAPAHDVDVMRRFRIQLPGLPERPLVGEFQPLVLEAAAVNALPEDALYVVGAVVGAQDLDRFLDRPKRVRQRGCVDQVLPVAAGSYVVLHAVDVGLQQRRRQGKVTMTTKSRIKINGHNH